METKKPNWSNIIHILYKLPNLIVTWSFWKLQFIPLQILRISFSYIETIHSCKILSLTFPLSRNSQRSSHSRFYKKKSLEALRRIIRRNKEFKGRGSCTWRRLHSGESPFRFFIVSQYRGYWCVAIDWGSQSPNLYGFDYGRAWFNFNLKT